MVHVWHNHECKGAFAPPPGVRSSAKGCLEALGPDPPINVRVTVGDRVRVPTGFPLGARSLELSKKKVRPQFDTELSLY